MKTELLESGDRVLVVHRRVQRAWHLESVESDSERGAHMSQNVDSELAIDTDRLTKVYGNGDTEVVSMRDASMQVRQGEVVALLGPSSSGKSTFLTAALDSQRGRQVMELFAEVSDQNGAGVIVVTHDQRSLDVFDTIYEMEDGVIERQPASVASTAH